MLNNVSNSQVLFFLQTLSDENKKHQNTRNKVPDNNLYIKILDLFHTYPQLSAMSDTINNNPQCDTL